MEGRCTCGEVRYRLIEEPLFVHCCHCTWCQRETGSAFALNALIETDNIELLDGEPEIVPIPSNSGRGQDVARCPSCEIALWSHYAGAGDAMAFVRVGTLDDPSAYPPDVHIFTSTKLSWIDLGGDVPIMPEYYRRSEHWPDRSLARWDVLKGRLKPA